MAREIKVTTILTVAKGELRVDERKSMVATMNGTHQHATVQDIGFAAHELLVVPADLATLGWGFLQNTDPTNYVEIGRDVSGTFYPVLKLKATEAFAVRLSNVALYAKANTGAVKLKFSLVED